MTGRSHLKLTPIFLTLALMAASCDGAKGGATPSATPAVTSTATPTATATATPSLQSKGFLAVANFSQAGPDAEPEVDARLTVYDVETGHGTDLGDVNSSCFSWSPDGRQLALGGSQGLAVATFPSGTVGAIDGLPAGTTLNCPGGWAPSGGRFTFAMSTDKGNSLWVADVAASAVYELVAASDNEQIATAGLWLDDNRVLAITQGVGDRGRILIVNGRTRAVEETYEPGGLLSGVSVRSDGLVAVGVSSGMRSAEGNRVVVLNPDTQDGTQLIDGAIAPMWSPEGSHVLAFEASYGKGPNVLTLFRADGSSPQPLLPEGAATGMGSWAIDASRLVVASVDANERDMRVTTYRWEGTNGLGERISEVALPESYPAAFGLVNPEYFGYLLSPAGDQLAVMSPTGKLSGNFNETKLFVADLVSGELRDTGEVGVFAGVAWSPR